MGSPQHFVALSEMQAQAYLVAMNALSLIDPKSAWISMTVTPEIVTQVSSFGFAASCFDIVSAEPKTTEVVQTHSRRQVRLGMPGRRSCGARRYAARVHARQLAARAHQAEAGASCHVA